MGKQADRLRLGEVTVEGASAGVMPDSSAIRVRS
jgi:hypothetical protein